MSCNQALFAFTLYVRFPTVLREPLSASVTFGRRPPQSNCPPDSVPRPDSWPMVRVPVLQGWYPKDGSAKTGVLVSKPPTYPVHVVPNPMSSYSKAPWGLSVLSQVSGIFTGITISPSLLLRQCPNRYAFRAGRNLPDKEFRYLRTVIVTAAVYWGLSSLLRLL